MNNKVLIFSLTAILFFYLNNSQGQIITDITPENIDEVVEEIFSLHGDQIDLSYNDLYNFLDYLLPDNIQDPDYDGSCDPPEPAMNSIDNTEISYSWVHQSGNHSYQTSYIKLNNWINTSAESGTIHTIGANVSLPIQSNGLVLVAFQAKCSQSTVGKVNVIIVDKPVFFEHSNEDCSCEFEGASQNASFSGTLLQDIGQTDIIDFDYTHASNTGYYSSTITYEDGSISTFLISVTVGENTIYIRKVCEENMHNVSGGTFLYSVIDQEVMGAVSFVNGISFDPVYGANGEMTVTECLEDEPDPGRSRPPWLKDNENPEDRVLNLIVQPNPGQDYVFIDLPESEQVQAANIQLLDIAGREIHLPKTNLSYTSNRIRLDINQLPVGVYSVLINSENQAMATRFIKVN